MHSSQVWQTRGGTSMAKRSCASLICATAALVASSSVLIFSASACAQTLLSHPPHGAKPDLVQLALVH